MMTDNQFNQLRSFVEEMNASNQTTYKISVLKKWSSDEFIKKVLYYTYNPFYQYYLTPDTLEKYYDEDLGVLYQFYDLFDMLDCLRSREVTGHKAINSVNEFCYSYEDYKDLIYKIIGKDLELRVGDTIINKIIPNLIPTFDVALATDFEKVDVDFHKDKWFASRKLDGVRCLAIVNDRGDVTLWSRQGKQFETLSKVESAIRQLGLTNCVFDGEICLLDLHGTEDFTGIMKEIRRKNHTIQTPKFLMFDYLTLDDFNRKSGTALYSERLAKLKHVCPHNAGCLSVIQQDVVTSDAHLEHLMSMSDALGWEGLILRKDVPYEGKRSKNMLKCKTFKDAEYVVESIETGPFRIIENGLETTIETMTNVNIRHKGYPVSVGSGWSLEERKHYFSNPDDIVGKVVTVKYFQESSNKNGELSLRFPTKKHVHGVSRSV